MKSNSMVIKCAQAPLKFAQKRQSFSESGDYSSYLMMITAHGRQSFTESAEVRGEGDGV